MDAAHGRPQTHGAKAKLSVPEEIEGRIQSIVFRAADGTFSVARILRDDSPDPITVAGYLTGTGPGERVRVKGDWETHPRFGRQFKVAECMPLLPASAEGIEAYLGSGLVEGIGPEMARRIVRRFGADALRVIEEEPKLLSGVPGIGPKRIAAIGEAWRQQRGVREATA
jgi:exodeoxyribonuclease V alpha subunit